MATLSEMVELNIEQLANKLDAGMPYTIISDIKHYETVLKSIGKNKNYKLLIFIAEEGFGKEHLNDGFNTFMLSAEDKEAAMLYAEDAKLLSSRIYIVR